MFPTPKPVLTPNTYAYESEPMVKATGFREYDARWLFGKEINLMGIQALGMGLGTMIGEMGVKREIVTGHDFRGYSASIKYALISGLLAAGCKVHDIGLCMTPMAYFAQFDLDVPCVAMVTASHNDNGWTGVKMGANRPLTFGPDEMTRLKEIVLNAKFDLAGGGAYEFVNDFPARYIADLTTRDKLKRKIRAVVACGNGTAGAFAPKILEAIGVDVIPLDTELDHTFPKYNPNPEDMEMLHAIRDAVLQHKADVGLGFDGDGDRCGVVDNTGDEIFADKVGVMLARDMSAIHKDARFVVDVKSTGLFVTDPVLQKQGAQTTYWKTGHSYMKRRTHELGALAGFEKSGPLLLQRAIRPRLRRRADLGDRGLRHARPRTGQVDGGFEGRTPEDVVVADDVAALRRRNQIRDRRAGGEAFRGCTSQRGKGRGASDPRSGYRQWRARHVRRRIMGPGARVVQQAGAGRRGRKPGLRAAHARHVRGDGFSAAHAPRGRRV